MTLDKYSYRYLALEIFMIVLALFIVFPFFFIIINTLKTNSEVLLNPLALPSSVSFDNYAEAFRKMNFWTSFKNTSLITLISVSLMVLMGSMAAYPVSRFGSRWTSLVLVYFLIGFMVPLQTTMVPLFVTIRNIGLNDSIYGVMLIYAANCIFSFFLYTGFMKTVPRELEEAGMIDGCNPWQIFWKIVFPLLKPVTVTIIILETMWVWNDFTFAYLFLHSKDKITLVLEIYKGVGEFSNDWPIMLSTMVIVILPAAIFYLVLQRQIISGLTSGALKG
ncbi:carbohydrate ABC transporter permease [Cohnella cellulosilytica]|uniref:Carbohydrate ABC transporter permease n=1 Tax=Cohnella cellulosilytica TaxID=986710 RepID=A0ABW2F6F3_9BACL